MKDLSSSPVAIFASSRANSLVGVPLSYVHAIGKSVCEVLTERKQRRTTSKTELQNKETGTCDGAVQKQINFFWRCAHSSVPGFFFLFFFFCECARAGWRGVCLCVMCP